MENIAGEDSQEIDPLMFAGNPFESLHCEHVSFYEDDGGDDASDEPGW